VEISAFPPPLQEVHNYFLKRMSGGVMKEIQEAGRFQQKQ
jgi:hypothetical protein